MHQRAYECRVNSVDELKQDIVEIWNSLQQNVIDAAINECRKRLRVCDLAEGQHFEHNFVYSQKDAPLLLSLIFSGS